MLSLCQYPLEMMSLFTAHVMTAPGLILHLNKSSPEVRELQCEIILKTWADTHCQGMINWHGHKWSSLEMVLKLRMDLNQQFPVVFAFSLLKLYPDIFPYK